MTSHVLHVFATFAAGGPQVRTTRLIGALGSKWRHSILAMDGVTSAEDILPEASVAQAEVLEPFPRAGSWPTVKNVRGLVKSLRPDLVCTYNWGSIEAIWAARSAGFPVLHHEDGFLPDELGGFKKRRVLTRRYTFRTVKGVVVPSHTLATIATNLWRLPQRKLHLIPNGIRLEKFPEVDGNAPLRDELGIPRDAFVVGSVGHLRTEKNPARLVRAVAKMQGTPHLVLVGDGPERAACEAAAKQSGIEDRVHLAGHREDTVPWYGLMNAFAISSDTEQMPVALLEAMASGIPVAATDVGDVKHMLPEAGRGYVVPRSPDVDDALAGALDRLAEDAQGRRSLAEAGRRRVGEQYAFEEMVRTYDELYARSAKRG